MFASSDTLAMNTRQPMHLLPNGCRMPSLGLPYRAEEFAALLFLLGCFQLLRNADVSDNSTRSRSYRVEGTLQLGFQRVYIAHGWRGQKIQSAGSKRVSHQEISAAPVKSRQKSGFYARTVIILHLVLVC